jgi:DNA (cytosine-5)-methyltransferase 1
MRWHLVGNAVCVDVARWVGERLAHPGTPNFEGSSLGQTDRWPIAAWGENGLRHGVALSERPYASQPDLRSFLSHPLHPLSLRAGGLDPLVPNMTPFTLFKTGLSGRSRT